MRDYLFSSLNEAAAYTRLENICPGGISKWSKESEYMILLFPTNRARKGWGVSEGIYVDTRNDQPYYIVLQYDGQIAAQVWYLDKDPLTFDDVLDYAREESEELYQKMQGISRDNWKDYAEECLRQKAGKESNGSEG